MIFRRRLEAVRDRLLELERSAPPEHRGGLDAILDVTETVLRTLGWEWPEPLTVHDLEFLASAGAL